MIIGSIVGGYEIIGAVIGGITAISAGIEARRSHNGEVIAPSHVDVPVHDYTGSAFLDPVNMND